MPRKYQKRDMEYWDSKNSTNTINEEDSYGNDGSPKFFDVSHASYSGCRENSSDISGSRTNRSYYEPSEQGYKNILSNKIPYVINDSKRSVNIKDAVNICQVAYASIGIIRNTVDVMSELANEDIFLEGGSKTSRQFFKTWLEVVNIDKIKEQFFREKFKTGNVFIYSFDGKIKRDYFEKYPKDLMARTINEDINIPLKYILLNPYDIASNETMYFSDRGYVKAFSSFEISRLKERRYEDDKNLWDSLDVDVKRQIENGATGEIYMRLNPERLSCSFYKKQDYEPFAIPMVWPVLDDIDIKLGMKKMDAAIMRSVENYILLITMGNEPSKGGINKKYLSDLKEAFMIGNIGSVLISDYTTKAEFVLPDLKKVVGEEKYTVINQDIKEALQNILYLEGTYSGLSSKLKIFLKKLNEERGKFLSDFLIPQMEHIAEKTRMKEIPIPKFKEIDFENKEALQRVALRLYELGAVSPEQLMGIFENGAYPKPEDISSSQEMFVDERERGFYNPIVGGVPMISSKAQKDQLGFSKEQFNYQKTQDKKNTQNPSIKNQNIDSKNETPKQSGRPMGSSKADLFYIKDFEKSLRDFQDFEENVVDRFKKENGIKRISKSDKEMCESLAKNILSSTERGDWMNVAEACLKDREKVLEISTVIPEIQKICDDNEIESVFWASILYNSKK